MIYLRYICLFIDDTNKKVYISISYLFDIMKKDELVHIRVGKELKEQMQILIEIGLFSNQAEIVREGLRDLLLKYERERHKKKK